MGGKSQTTTSNSTSSYTPAALQQLQDIYNKASSAASTPYTPYGGQLTAGLTDTQQAGIGNVNAAANAAQPYFDTAKGYATQGGSSITPQQIQQYQNPYTQSVIDATQRQFAEQNGQQQQQVLGNAASQGALGGDRSAVLQALTAGQQQMAQAPVIANLQSQGYQQALGAAQADRAAAQTGASQFASLGTGAQSAALQGAGAQLQAGGIEQGTNQNALSAAYQQWLNQQAAPYQNAQFLASIGIPAAGAMGGTTTGQGTTTSPGPNLTSQLLGLGTAALMFKDGGAVPDHGFASGGQISPFNLTDAVGYIPKPISISGGSTKPPALEFPKAAGDSSGGAAANNAAMGAIGKGIGGLKGMFSGESYGGGNIFNSEWGGSSSSPLEGLDASDYGPGFADGGSVDDRFAAVEDAIKDGTFDPQGANYTPFSASVMAEAAPPTALDSVPLPAPSPFKTATAQPASPFTRSDLPPQITGAPEDNELPASAMAFDRPAQSPMAAAAQPDQGQSDHTMGGLNLFGLSDKARQSIIAAGLATAASRSPFALSAIGEGGLAGLSTYGGLNKAEQEAAEKKVAQQQNQRRIELEAQRIAEQTSDRVRDYELAVRRQNEIEKQNRLDADRGKWTYLGPSKDGTKSVFLNTITGEPVEREGTVGAKTAKPLPTSAIKSLSDAGSTFSDFDRLTSTYKPEYAGKMMGIVGDAQNLVGRNVGAGYGDQAQWWQDYQTQKNMVRHALFGSALTATEKGEFDRAAITPGMSDETVTKNLQRQRMIAQRAARKLGEAYRKSGYSEEAIEAAIGVPLSELAPDDKGAAASTVPPSEKRELNKVYTTPTGRRQWLGNGWGPAQ